MTDHLEVARKVAQQGCGSLQCASQSVAALDRAGLLRTDLHERALKACEQPFIDWHICAAIGRESLQAKQPKPRWTVREAGLSPILGRGGYILDDTHTPGRNMGGLTKSQAHAVAEALNKLEGEAESARQYGGAP